MTTGLGVGTFGAEHAARTAVVDPDGARAYAAATDDDDPAYGRGAVAPPLFGAVVTWASLGDALGDMVSAADLPRLVHVAHDVHLSGPLVPGRRLVTVARAFALRPGRTGRRCTAQLTSRDQDTGAVVLVQYATVLVRGRQDDASSAAALGELPGHDFPPGDAARARPAGRGQVAVAPDQARRYAAASGDHNPIHLDEGAARAAGLPGPVLHGLCTMALAGRAVLGLVADGRPHRLRRLAVRFAGPVRPGTTLTVSAYDGGPAGDGVHRYPFEVHDGDRLVGSHGRVEVAP